MGSEKKLNLRKEIRFYQPSHGRQDNLLQSEGIAYGYRIHL